MGGGRTYKSEAIETVNAGAANFELNVGASFAHKIDSAWAKVKMT